MSADILVRFTDVQAAALKARREKTLVPTSAFIRRTVEKALEQVIIDAEPIAEPKEYKPVKLLIPEMKVEHVENLL